MISPTTILICNACIVFTNLIIAFLWGYAIFRRPRMLVLWVWLTAVLIYVAMGIMNLLTYVEPVLLIEFIPKRVFFGLYNITALCAPIGNVVGLFAAALTIRGLLRETKE